MTGVERHRGTGPTSGDDGVRSAAREVYAGILDRAPEHDFAPTLDRVRALASHPAFSLANPNRTRALIWTFGQSNLTQFNRTDGAGYAFVADTVLALGDDGSLFIDGYSVVAWRKR